MIQAVIVIELTSGAKIKYVRDVLYAKSGDDGATIPTQKDSGVATRYYSYTGDGDDTYEDQTGNPGLLVNDYNSIETSFTASTPKYLAFPESTGSTETLIRYNQGQLNGRRTYTRTKILKDKIARIFIEEVWSPGIDLNDSKNTLPTWSNRFMADGWNEDRNGPFTFPAETSKILPSITASATSTGNSITLSWSKKADYATYNVFLNNKLIASNQTGTSYTFTGLVGGTRYSVGINGDTGTKIGPTTYLSKTTVMAETSISHTENAYSIDLSWTAVVGAVSYRVYKDSTLVKNNIRTTSYTLTDLTPDTEYDVSIQSVGTFSDNQSVASFSATTDMIAPTITSTANSTTTSITINWTNLKTGYRYKIYRDGVAGITTLANVTTYTYTGLTAGTEYDLSITAINTSDDEGPESNIITKSTQAL